MIVQAPSVPAWRRHNPIPKWDRAPDHRHRDGVGRFTSAASADRDGGWTFGSLALKVQVPPTLPETPEPPDLLWPPALPEREPVRGRPERRDALWRAVAAQTRSQARAILVVAHDILAHRRRVRLDTRGAGFLVERCSRYYSAGGDLGITEARAALDVVLVQLRASPVTVAELHHHAIPTRNTGGRAHAQHWFLTPGACEDLAHVLGLLSAYGIRRPPASRRLRALQEEVTALDVRVRSRRWWAVCPCHVDTDPSLLLNPDGSAWCFGGCGLVGRWTDADRDAWAPASSTSTSTSTTPAPASAPSTALFRAFVDPEAMVVLGPGRSQPGQAQGRRQRRAGEGIERGESAAWTAAHPAETPKHAEPVQASRPPAPVSAQAADLPTPRGFYGDECNQLQPASFDLGLHRGRPYSRLQAAQAGRPGSDPSVFWSCGRRLVVAKLAQTQVWGRLKTQQEPDLYQECRPWGIVLAKRSSRGMKRSYAKATDLLAVLATADRSCRGPKSYTRAVAAFAVVVGERRKWGGGTPDKDVLPDLFVSLDHHQHTRYRNGFDREVKEIRDQAGKVTRLASVLTVVPPDGFEPASTRWVGVDIDDILIPWTTVEGESDAADAFPLVDQRGGAGSYGDERLKVAAGKIQALVQRHPLFTGRLGLVRTGPRGVQVVVELETSRWRTRELWQDQDFKAMVHNLSERVLVELRAVGCDGGKVDASAMASGRYFRRPGWRVAKDGSLFRARLIFSSP